jgi:phosphatidylserine decarboxylase
VPLVLLKTLIGGLLGFATTLPLAWKWRLGLRRTAPVAAVLALVAAGVVAAIGAGVDLGNGVALAFIAWLLTLLLAAAAVAYRFYRDPERRAPEEDGVIVSPADGEVLYVREADKGRLPVASKQGRAYSLQELTRTPLESEDAVVVGIGLSLLDVHVNRSPIAGRISLVRRFPGRFGSLRRPEMVFENERTTMLIERSDLQLAIVLIASRLVRRIVAYVREGDEVAVGQRLGMIRFGSQVDLVLPIRENLRVKVRPGDPVRAGESTIAVLDDA